jgi:hypothetical protein
MQLGCIATHPFGNAFAHLKNKSALIVDFFVFQSPEEYHA